MAEQQWLEGGASSWFTDSAPAPPDVAKSTMRPLARLLVKRIGRRLAEEATAAPAAGKAKARTRRR
jgi:hypothetical protein